MTILGFIGIMCLGFFIGNFIDSLLRLTIKTIDIKLCAKKRNETVNKQPIGFCCEAVNKEES